MTEDWPPKPPVYQNIIPLYRGELSISQRALRNRIFEIF